jgi:hypothetical protein
MNMRGVLLAMGVVLIAAACGGDAEPTTTAVPAVTTGAVPSTAAPVTTATPPSPTTTTVAVTTTTVIETTTTTTTVPPSVCPVSIPLPEGTVAFAAVGGDFDGDGAPDELQTYQAATDTWRMRITFADGGGADAAIAGAEDFAPPRPIGGFDIESDGAEEVFITIGSGASTVLVGFFDVVDCVATRITAGGSAAEFPVGASIGSISGLACPGDGSIHRNFAQFIADDVYEGGFEPFVLEDSVLIAFPGDGAGFTADEAFALAILDCGGLTLP